MVHVLKRWCEQQLLFFFLHFFVFYKGWVGIKSGQPGPTHDYATGLENPSCLAQKNGVANSETTGMGGALPVAPLV